MKVIIRFFPLLFALILAQSGFVFAQSVSGFTECTLQSAQQYSKDAQYLKAIEVDDDDDDDDEKSPSKKYSGHSNDLGILLNMLSESRGFVETHYSACNNPFSSLLPRYLLYQVFRI